MKKLISLLTIFLITVTGAQTPDSLKNKWIPSLITQLGINQVAFGNWVKGGENSIAWALTGDFRYNMDGDVWTFKNQVKATYGRSKVGDASYRTTNNDLYLENVAIYNLGWAVSPFSSNAIRTQAAKGYYYKNPLEPNISDFFDPGYLTQTIGFTYDKYKSVVTRFGLAFQEVITNKFTSYSDKPSTTEIEKFKLETGIESVTDFNFNLAENIIYLSKFRLFSRFESLDVWDIRFDNTITASVNTWLKVNFTYNVLYEKAQSPLTQTMQTLQIGITYTLL